MRIVSMPNEDTPEVEPPVIEPGPPKKPRSRFQVRLWMVLLAMVFFSVVFEMVRPRQNPYAQGIDECHIQVRNVENDLPARVYSVVFLDDSREWYRTHWVGGEEILVSIEIRDKNGTRIYVREKTLPSNAGFIDEPMQKVFEQIRDLAKARAEDPKVLRSPVYGRQPTGKDYAWPARKTTAYLFEDPPHAESGRQRAPSATPTSTQASGVP